MGKLAYFIAGVATGIASLIVAAYCVPETCNADEEQGKAANSATTLNAEAEQENGNEPSDPMPQQA